MAQALSPRTAPWLMVLSGTSMYAGAALAVHLFTQLPPATVALLRMLSAGLILLAIVRPPLRLFWGEPAKVALLYGLATAGMNIAFYEAIARVPLGLVVAIEFFGPVAVAALTSRGLKEIVSVVAAGIGVVCVSGAQWAASPSGIAFSLAAAALWAAYIVLGARLSRRSHLPVTHQMAVGFTLSAVVLAPCVLTIDFLLRGSTPTTVTAAAGISTTDYSVLTLVVCCIGLGLLSTLVPYLLDQVALKIVSRDTFAVLLAILPLTAAAIGFLLLNQHLSLLETMGVACIIVAVVLRQPPRRRPAASIQA